MPAVKIALRALAARNLSTPELLDELNRVFLDSLQVQSYFTLIYAVFDPAASRVAYANAGHPPALHLKAGGGEEWLTTEGPAVGLLHQAVRFETVDVTFEPGDVFVFYTDGITEAEEPGGADFGRERLAATVRAVAAQPAGAIVSAVHDAVDSFRGSGPDGDDATVIAVRVPVR
jgi:sigma-B regulation protein RsbU (phosphoserine phosphatase)